MIFRLTMQTTELASSLTMSMSDDAKVRLIRCDHVAADCYLHHDYEGGYAQADGGFVLRPFLGRPSAHVLMPLCAGVYWQDGPSTHTADLIDNSMPILYRKMLHKRVTKDIADADR